MSNFYLKKKILLQIDYIVRNGSSPKYYNGKLMRLDKGEASQEGVAEPCVSQE